MICPFCNREINNSSNFCIYCGKHLSPPQTTDRIPVTPSVPTYERQPAPTPQQVYAPPRQPRKTSNGILVPLIIALVVAIMGVICLVIVLMAKSEPADFSEKPYVSNQTSSTTTAQPVFPRYETYSDHYYYKNMPAIHSSVPASDSECFELQGVILDFNTLWISFINSSDYSVYSYLRSGTPAYGYANSYGRKNITEEFEQIDVKDVRKTNSYYFVWVHEKIVEHHPGTDKHLEYHWVYKIGKDSNGYYVENYSRDPYYNN